MATMGTHSRPIDGTVTANGHQLVPLAMPQQQRGSTSAEPQPNERERHWDGDTVIRVLAAAVVLAVAAFAAIVSYSHIFELGSHHGQDGTAARLLPLSVDGLIAAASLVMLHAARRKLPVPQLARWMLGLGVAATVAANVEYGMPFGWLAAVVSAWPRWRSSGASRWRSGSSATPARTAPLRRQLAARAMTAAMTRMTSRRASWHPPSPPRP